MLSDLAVTRSKMIPIKSLLYEIMSHQESEAFFQQRSHEFKGNFIYIFKVKRKNLEWKINKRLVDFEHLADQICNKLGADFSNFGTEGDIQQQALFLKLQNYLHMCLAQGNSLAAVMLEFLEESGHAYDGLDKYKQISMLKKAGGRYQQSCLKCGSLFKSWKLRYFIIHNQGIIYKDQQGNVKQYLSYDYDFKMGYGKSETSDQLGIVLTSTHRRLKLKALNLFDWIQFIYYVKIGFNSCQYVSINRYGSFAPIRNKCKVKFLIDGEEYFHSVAISIASAKKEVFITDWWLSPQFYLIRPINQATKQFRLDRLLERIAKKGVRVNIIVYQESTFLLNDSLYTKTYLESLHSNIKVLRHPATVLPILWSHHQKMVIVDQTIGYLGGLDLCYGRWDTQKHLLFDPDKNIYPGIQYNNIRAQDIINVRDFQTDQYQREKARLPWHDIGCFVQGEAVWDLSRHFIQYWNYASFQKQGNDRQLLMRNPYKKPNLLKKKLGQGLQKLIDIKNKIKQKFLSSPQQEKPVNRIHAYINQKTVNQSMIEANEARWPQDLKLKTQSPLNCQNRLAHSLNLSVVHPNPFQPRRSMDLSNIQKIDDGFMDILHNIKQPGADEEDEESQDFTFKEIMEQSRNDDHKVYTEDIEHIEKPIAYKQLEVQKDGMMECQIVRSVGPWSIGCSKESTECSIQVAYVELIANSKYYIYIENQFFISSCADPKVVKNQIANALALRIRKAAEKGQKFRVYVVLPLLPGFAGEIDDPEAKILKLQMHWQYQTICRGRNSLISQLRQHVSHPEQYIKFMGLRTHSRISQNHRPITEIIYVHSKLMIVDDQYVILGSANINDRSMKGKRDSEICMVNKDTETITTLIDGEMKEVSKSCSILRKRLFQQHFGLVSERQLDPLSGHSWQLLSQIALQNTEIYRQVFSCYPDDQIKNMLFLIDFKTKGDANKYEELKDLIRGNVVEYPLYFLGEENLNLRITQKQYLIPTSFAT